MQATYIPLFDFVHPSTRMTDKANGMQEFPGKDSLLLDFRAVVRVTAVAFWRGVHPTEAGERQGHECYLDAAADSEAFFHKRTAQKPRATEDSLKEQIGFQVREVA